MKLKDNDELEYPNSEYIQDKMDLIMDLGHQSILTLRENLQELALKLVKEENLENVDYLNLSEEFYSGWVDRNK